MGKSSKKSSTSTTTYGTTKTTNPYVVSKTNNKGTKSSFVQGSAFDTVNNYVNENIGNILDDYLNPSLNSSVNKALLDNYVNNLSASTKASLENNIINPLSDRNMIRSSQAADMYKNLSDSNTSNISAFISDLLKNSQQNSANMLSNLLNAYTQGYNVINSNQAQSLNTSKGNATKVNSISSNGGIMDTSSISDIAKVLMALMA